MWGFSKYHFFARVFIEASLRGDPFSRNLLRPFVRYSRAAFLKSVLSQIDSREQRPKYSSARDSQIGSRSLDRTLRRADHFENCRVICLPPLSSGIDKRSRGKGRMIVHRLVKILPGYVAGKFISRKFLFLLANNRLIKISRTWRELPQSRYEFMN